MDPPPPYDPRRHPHYHLQPSSSHSSHPQDYLRAHPHHQTSNSSSSRFPSTTPVYYLNNRDRSIGEVAERSASHQLQSRRADGSGTATSKHQRATDGAAGSSDQRDHKRSRSDIRERNSRSGYDSKANNKKDDSNSRKNRKNHDKEKRKVSDTDKTKKTPQKPIDESRVSVWNRIEEKPSSLTSPTASNQAGVDRVIQEIKPENELTGPYTVPEKELDPIQENTESKPDEAAPKKKKVVIRRRIVKKMKNNPDDPTMSADQVNELSGSGSGNPRVGVRRVKRVIIVKKKKGAMSNGETNEEEIVRQIANQVFSENKSIEGSKISPEKSVNDVDTIPKLELSDKGILVRVESTAEKNSSELLDCKSKENNGDDIVGTSTLKVCTKEEIVEMDLNVSSANYCTDPVCEASLNGEAKSPVVEENQEKDNMDTFPLALCDNSNIDLVNQGELKNSGAISVDIRDEEMITNEEKDEAMEGALDINCLNTENLGSAEENINLNLNLGEISFQIGHDLSASSPQSDQMETSSELRYNEGNIHESSNSPDQMDVSVTEADQINSDQMEESITRSELIVPSSTNSDMEKGKGKGVLLPVPQKEIKKQIYQKSIPVPPKFPTNNLNRKPQNKTWRREDATPQTQTKWDIIPQNAYIRKGNSLIRSSSGSNIVSQSTKVLVPRIPSPNPNPNPNSPVNESDSEIDKLGHGNGTVSSKMVYLKKKSNQIVLNNHNGYSSDNLNSNSNSDEIRDSNSVHYSSDSTILTVSINKINNKVLRQRNKGMRFPNVWTLNSKTTGTQAKRKTGRSYSYHKSIPSLLPWKRTTLLRNSTRRSPILLKTPISHLIRKLVLARRRNTVYKVSKDGFSICKAGVVSIGGSNLKWSRSIDTDSKKANQEATKAVAEAERKKREKKKPHPNKAKKGLKASLNLNNSSSSSGYVRVSKGKLVRDPKKLVRMLASEKVQRSLHTLRTRYKRKQQYCLFYTRFGFCNKAEGKCNYIHDPAKIAICTKFLRGLCVSSTCKLTHEINPQRMPDCSYFLQGLCTNLTCSYRHVKVNPNAPICDGFLRGYCSDGDECRKKHSYTCPQFEQNGECPQGSKCKLYHPKSKNTKSGKRKASSALQSPSCGIRPRYFESSIDSGEPVSCGEKKNGTEFSEGQFGDCVSLTDEVDGEVSAGDMDVFEPMQLGEMELELDSEGSDLEMDDELIKPVRVFIDSGLVIS